MGSSEILEPKKWEYSILIFRVGLITKSIANLDDLNNIGDAGWELINVVATEGNFIYFFKREKISVPEAPAVQFDEGDC